MIQELPRRKSGSWYGYGTLGLNEIKVFPDIENNRRNYRALWMNIQYWNKSEPQLSGKQFKLITIDNQLAVKRIK